ncbi:MAG: DUF4149 domain-containing protein [candidate division NC10 bacterium]|jgi:uncharacterized membrane protein
MEVPFRFFRGKNIIYLTLVTLHLLGAVIWIGGMLFLGFVLTPVLRGYPPAERAVLLSAVGRRFLNIGWTALGVLLLTGPTLWALRGFQVTPALGIKLILVALILYLSILHDFFLGPRLVAHLEQGNQGSETLRLRRRVALLARLNVLFAIVVLVLGLAVSRGF